MQNISLDSPSIDIHGALDFDKRATGITPRRLPAWTRPQVPVFMELMVTQPSGVRLRFTTDSRNIALKVLLTRLKMADREPRKAVFDLVCDNELANSQELSTGNVLAVDLARPTQPEFIPGDTGTVLFADLPEGTKTCELWLPSGAQVELQALAVDDDASFTAAPPVAQKLWVHHGSSISHCAEATRPTQTWPAVAARLGDLDLLNLGLGGNCQLDAFVARTIRDLQAHYITLKLGINVVNMDSMRERTFTPAVHGFLDTIREKHERTPILIVSPIYCPSAEQHPGPTLPDENGKFVTFPGNEHLRAGCLTLTWIRKILSKVVAARHAAGDDALYYLDGLELFSQADVAHLPDDLHPDGEGYVTMGQRFYEKGLKAVFGL